jgi:predicted Zn-dependent protease with MMP-like domain
LSFDIDLKELEKEYSIMPAQEFALLRRGDLTPEAAEIYDRVAIRRAEDTSALEVPSESSDTSRPNTALIQEATGSETFEDIVEWAYNTLPQRIKDLPDFPGIQVVDEVPAGLLETYPQHANALGLFVGRSRIEREYTDLHRIPDLIFVFQGPLIRYAKGNLRSQVKRTVWHEVAHWLGYGEEDMEELGL